MPYSIIKLKPHNDRFVVKLENVDTESGAKELSGKDIYLPSEMLPELDGDKFYFHEVPGWTVVDLENGTELGEVIRVIDHGPYPMLEVESNGEELILPLPENFKIEVDRENKVLRVEVPEGLVDVFVNPSKREMDDGDDDNEVWL